MFGEDGKKANWGYCCDTMGEALERKDELLQKYPEVIIRDNATRMETHFIRQIVEGKLDEQKEGA